MSKTNLNFKTLVQKKIMACFCKTYRDEGYFSYSLYLSFSIAATVVLEFINWTGVTESFEIIR